MAIMKPVNVEMFNNKSEENAYKMLQSLDNSFSVVYEPSIGLQQRRTPDFVVLAERLGLIVLDVKYVKLDNIKETNAERIIKKDGTKMRNFSKIVQDYAFKVNNQLEKEFKENSTIIHPVGHKNAGKLTFPYSSGLILYIDEVQRYTKEDVARILSLHIDDFIIANDVEDGSEVVEFLTKLNRPFHAQMTTIMKDEILKKLYINSDATSTEFINTMSQYILSLKKSFQNELDGSHFEKSKQLKQNLIAYTKFAQESIEVADKNLGLGCDNIIEKLKGYKEELEDEKFTVAVFGYFSTGKSTFLNTLMDTDKLPMDEDRSTATFTRLRHISKSDKFENGDMEVIYKTKLDISNSYKEAINNLPLEEEQQQKYIDFEKLQTFQEELQEELKTIRFRDFDVTQRDKIKNAKNTISYILENPVEYGMSQKIAKEDIHTFLTDDKKAFVISEVVYYLDNELLKDIEIVDTPGYGSENTMDTQKTEEFVKEANVLILLTEAKDPMSKEDEHKFLETYEGIYRQEDGSVNTDNLFVIANKVDASSKSVQKIKDSIVEKIEDNWEDALVIHPEHIFTMSSKYHYDKNTTQESKIESENISEDDLENFKQSYSKFLTQNKDKELVQNSFYRIDSLIQELEDVFTSTTKEINKDIVDIQKKKEQFVKSEKEIQDSYHTYTHAISHVQVDLKRYLKQHLKGQKINDVDKITESYNKFLESKGKKPRGATKELTSQFFKEYITEVHKELSERNNTLFVKLVDKQLISINRQIEKYSLELEAMYGISGLEKKITIKEKMVEKELDNAEFPKGVLNAVLDVLAFGLFVNSKDYAKQMVEQWKDSYYNKVYNAIYMANDDAMFEVLKEFKIQNNDIIKSVGNKLLATEKQIKAKMKDQEDYNTKITNVKSIFKKIDEHKTIIQTQEQELYGDK